MPVFMVEVRVVGKEKYYVEADDKEEAIKIVKNGEQMIDSEQDLEFIYDSFVVIEEL